MKLQNLMSSEVLRIKRSHKIIYNKNLKIIRISISLKYILNMLKNSHLITVFKQVKIIL